jgi:hypothetical protein
MGRFTHTPPRPLDVEALLKDAIGELRVRRSKVGMTAETSLASCGVGSHSDLQQVLAIAAGWERGAGLDAIVLPPDASLETFADFLAEVERIRAQGGTDAGE